jgi:hypothetical protein
MRALSSKLLHYSCLIAGLVAGVAVFHADRADAHPMGDHMTMTALRPIQPGDRARADAVLAGARATATRYTDFHKALADGYTIFLPEFKQNVYHFTNNAHALGNTMRFDAARPTSLLYEKTSKPGTPANYKLVGVMYTAPYEVTEDVLDARVPLSIAQWHLHTNLCVPPRGEKLDPEALQSPDSKFGLQGSITTAAECRAAGGRFMPHLFGWMVHVYPFEKDPAKIWADGMDDDHGMQHDAMPAGMPM